jgi:hypothetical protein
VAIPLFVMLTIGLIALAVSSMASGSLHRPVRLNVIPIACLVLWTLSWPILTMIGIRDARRRLRAAEFCLCGECLYPLDHTVSEGICPECGTRYRPPELTSAWQRYLDSFWPRT